MPCTAATKRGKASKGKVQVPENVEYRTLSWRLCSNDVTQQMALGYLQSWLQVKVGEMVCLWLCCSWVHLPLTVSDTVLLRWAPWPLSASQK